MADALNMRSGSASRQSLGGSAPVVGGILAALDAGSDNECAESSTLHAVGHSLQPSQRPTQQFWPGAGRPCAIPGQGSNPSNAPAHALVIDSESGTVGGGSERTQKAWLLQVFSATGCAATFANVTSDDNVATKRTVGRKTSDDSVDEEEMTYLWQQRSDEQLVGDLDALLQDFDLFAFECDQLYDACVQQDVRLSEMLPLDQLHVVTQRLIDRFGVRSEPVLERIGMVYAALSDGCGPCVGKTEFRGYVASLLTQMRRELYPRALQLRSEAKCTVMELEHVIEETAVPDVLEGQEHGITIEPGVDSLTANVVAAEQAAEADAGLARESDIQSPPKFLQSEREQEVITEPASGTDTLAAAAPEVPYLPEKQELGVAVMQELESERETVDSHVAVEVEAKLTSQPEAEHDVSVGPELAVEASPPSSVTLEAEMADTVETPQMCGEEANKEVMVDSEAKPQRSKRTARGGKR